MKHTLYRAIAIATITASAVFSALSPALAQGNWSWTDISDKIAERQNRPVWAMAYASPYWYFTDGQDLYSGGHVWKTEGTAMSDMTSDVRNAGISRVDDIVTDGTTVLFLKNITPRNNSIEVLAYNGSFTSLTSRVQQNLSSNEGVVQIVGQNGSWAVATTLGRIMLITPSTNVVRNVTLPNFNNGSQIPYIQNHATSNSSTDHLPLSIQPYRGNWLVEYSLGNGQTIVQIDTNGNVSGAVGLLMTYIDAFVSNGQTVLIAQSSSQGNNIGFTDSTFNTYDGSLHALSQPSSLTWRNSVVAWDGTTWIIIQGKSQYGFDGTSFTSFGQTTDLFLNAAGNGAGTFLLGGAVSDVNSGNNPSSPLTLKLAMAQEYYVNNSHTDSNNNYVSYAPTTNGGGGTYTSSNGPTITTSGGPSGWSISNGDTFGYHAYATDPSGIDHIDLYVNSALIKSCNTSSCDFSAQYFTNGLSTRAVLFQTRATDRQGFSTAGNTETLTVNMNGGSSGTTTNTQTQNGTSFWTWTNPNQTYIGQNQTMTYYVGAYDASGINNIQMYVNGNVKNTCSLGNALGSQQCNTAFYGSDYGLNTNVAINAKITSGNGNVVWTTLQNINVTDNGSSSNAVGDVSTWTTLDPTGSTLNTNSSVIFHVNGTATRGLNQIDVYANGSVIRTCNYNQLSGNQTCDVTLYGNNYSNQSTLSLNAKATDSNNQTAWSDTKSLNVTNNTNNNNNTGSANTWISSNPDTSTISSSQNVIFTANATDPSGIRRIEIFVNGNSQNVCDNGYTSNNTVTCSSTLTSSNYSNGTSVYVNAKVTNGNGNVTWTQSRSYTVNTSNNNNNNNTNNTNSGSAYTWTWSTPEVSQISTGDQVQFSVGANDPDGIRKIEFLVNGSVNRTCDLGYTATGNQQCTITVSGSSYSAGSSVYVNARITDGNGNITWSNSKTYNIVQSSNGTPVSQNSNMTATLHASSGSNTITRAQTDDLWVYVDNTHASTQRVEYYVNGSVAFTCDKNVNPQWMYLGTLFQCPMKFNASSYPAGSDVFVNAKATDSQGNVAWTNSWTYHIGNDAAPVTPPAPIPTNLAGTVSVTSNHDNGFANGETVSFAATANDNDGIAKIDLLVNAVLVKTCYNVSSCGYTGGPYNDRTTVSYGARMTDNQGNVLWTGYKTINKR